MLPDFSAHGYRAEALLGANEEGGRLTYEDLKSLKMRDLRKVTDLLAKAGDTGEEDEDEFPNE